MVEMVKHPHLLEDCHESTRCLVASKLRENLEKRYPWDIVKPIAVMSWFDPLLKGKERIPSWIARGRSTHDITLMENEIEVIVEK